MMTVTGVVWSRTVAEHQAERYRYIALIEELRDGGMYTPTFADYRRYHCYMFLCGKKPQEYEEWKRPRGGGK